MSIRAGQIYQSVNARTLTTDGPVRIRVIDDPTTITGLYGSGKVRVETVRPDGTGMRPRRIEVTQLHESATTQHGQPRCNGYVLVNDTQETPR